jgi:hypothetical protein
MVPVGMSSYDMVDVARVAIVLCDVLRKGLTRILKSAIHYMDIRVAIDLVAKRNRIAALHGFDI